MEDLSFHAPVSTRVERTTGGPKVKSQAGFKPKAVSGKRFEVIDLTTRPLRPLSIFGDIFHKTVSMQLDHVDIFRQQYFLILLI